MVEKPHAFRKFARGITALAAAWALLAGCARDQGARFSRLVTEYHYPLASPGVMFSRLPQKVQNTIRAETGSEQLADVITRETPTGPVYEIHFQNEQRYPPLLARPDGSLLNSDLTIAVGAPGDRNEVLTGGTASNLPVSELSPGALKVVKERAGTKPISNISRETWGSRTVYVITIQDGSRSEKVYVAADGTVLNETSR